MRIEGRNHDARARYRNEQVHIGGSHAGLLQRALGHLQTEFDGLFLILRVDLRQRAGLNRVFQGKYAVTLIDRRIVDHFANGIQLCGAERKNAADVVFHDFTGQDMRRYCRRGPGDSSHGRRNFPLDVDSRRLADCRGFFYL